MKTILTAIALSAAMGTAALAADPIVGTWQTIKDDNGNSGQIKVVECGAAICGTLVQSFDSAGKPFASKNKGRKLIWDMKNQGGGKYAGGKVFSPDRDKTYNGQLVLSGNTLDVKGCVLGICRSGGKWSRVK
ncbi:hypothetical protein Z946_2925 [Sulfitobacter noctilucicola]|uniref:Uncharacterized protein (DUF2147 family) n=1 Tax=Sulfitobacter noctilucicola TaxID=1342301 RepID=A0A7W6MAQ4_9RHOB|nr:DUF2147 domain-containing protein [Sulfitobacter noctilucicola]KIN64040.1 hypothetical protein Z946_2925 [Sulfitobacter noctilucicola]MBB4175396.1 uncharacterized protein (DUF2147 family) [Sulfitobacter noctilucicola]